MKMPREEQTIKTKICPVCGREFIVAPNHAYKRNIHKKTTLICSYHCLLEFDRQREKTALQTKGEKHE